MKINKIRIENFRGIEDLRIDLHPQFNLFIGENGSGKTAILEAVCVAIGGFFLGFPGIPSRTIRNGDIRYFKTIEGSYEYASYTRITVEKGFIHFPPAAYLIDKKDHQIQWTRERIGIHGKTLHEKTTTIKSISQELNYLIRNSNRDFTVDLPVLAYYSTARLWKERRENDSKVESTSKSIPTRFRGYKDALEINSSFKIMLDWFEGKFKENLNNKETSFQLESVINVIVKNIPGASNIKWVFDPDRIQTLYIVFDNKQEIPFHYLSDGYRNLLAIFSDIAYRCVTLNPHFKTEANLKSEGIVLIDELDLHLHPSWQQEIVKKLKLSFPKIQFLATTHSPFIMQEMEDNEVYKINSTADNILHALRGLNRLGIEDIAEDVQGVDTPNMSTKREEMFKAAEEYYKLLDSAEKASNPEKLQELKDKLDSITELYSDDVAYYAFMKQERLTRGL